MIKTRIVVIISLAMLLLGCSCGTTAGVIVGFKINQKPEEKQDEQTTITQTVVLERIKEQSFLVTRTVITDQDVVIKIEKDSAWSNFWWGHKITATGKMQTDIGVDLSKISEDDIEVNHEDKVVRVKLPDAEIYNVSLEGDIEVKTESGILKRLLAGDANEDYNLALEKLETEVRNVVQEDKELMEESQDSALVTIGAILKETGYEVETRNSKS